jgi:flagellar hook-length control protein FliK
MQTTICSPVQNADSPIAAAKASSGNGNGSDFMQTLAGIMRRANTDLAGTGRRIHIASDTSGGSNNTKANSPDTGGGIAAALSQPLMVSLIMAFQASGAQAQSTSVVPTMSAAADVANSPAQNPSVDSDVMMTVPSSAKGADMPSALTGSGVIPHDGSQGMADATTVADKKPDSGINAGNPLVITARQAITADDSSSGYSAVKAGSFTANFSARSADPQVNVTQVINTQTQGDETKAGHDTAPPGSVLQGAQSVSPAAVDTHHTAADNTARFEMTPLSGDSTQTSQQPVGVSVNLVADKDAKGVQSLAFTSSVFAVRAKDEPNANVHAVKPQTGAAKQYGADISGAVQSAGGAKEGQGSSLAKDNGGKGRQQNAADGSSNAISLFGVKSDQVSGVDVAKAKSPDVTDIARQLSDACRSAADQGTSEIRVHLSPEDLGGINIRIISQNGVLSLQISADSRHTGEMLQSNLTELNRSMSDNGVNMNKVEVYYSHSGAFDASAGSFGGRQQNFSGNSGSAATWMPVAPAKDDIEPVTLSNGRMSIFA